MMTKMIRIVSEESHCSWRLLLLEFLQRKLEIFLEKLLTNSDNIAEILNLDSFLQFVQYFPDEKKPEVCKRIIEIFLSKTHGKKIGVPVTVHTLLQLASYLNPFKSLELSESKAQEVSSLVIGILRSVDYQKDVE